MYLFYLECFKFGFFVEILLHLCSIKIIWKSRRLNSFWKLIQSGADIAFEPAQVCIMLFRYYRFLFSSLRTKTNWNLFLEMKSDSLSSKYTMTTLIELSDKRSSQGEKLDVECPEILHTEYEEAESSSLPSGLRYRARMFWTAWKKGNIRYKWHNTWIQLLLFFYQWYYTLWFREDWIG